MVKIPDPRFKRYSLRLREEGGSLLGPSQWKENELVWGKPVRLYEFTEYEAEELAARSPFWLSVFWKLWGNDKRLEIWGQRVKDDTWVPISPWLLKEQRASEHRQPSVPSVSGEEPVAARAKGGGPTAMEETQANAQRDDPPATSKLQEGKLEDEAHADCVGALMSKLSSEGRDPEPECYYDWYGGVQGRVDCYHFDKSTGECVVYEVKTQIDNVQQVLGKLDEYANVFPKYLKKEHALRSLATHAHLVVLATRSNMDVIWSNQELFKGKFSRRPERHTRFILQVFNPVTAELQTLLPVSAGQRLERQTLQRWVRFPSKGAFLEAWRKRSTH